MHKWLGNLFLSKKMMCNKFATSRKELKKAKEYSEEYYFKRDENELKNKCYL